MHLPSRDDLSDLAWRLRCKIIPPSDSKLKSVSDFSSSVDGSLEKQPAKGKAAKAAGKPLVGGTPGKDPNFGADAVIKTFYEGKNSNEGYYDWVDYPPKQLSKSAAKAQDRVAIKVYKVKDKDKPVISGRFQLRYHQLDIQNATLVAAIEDILKKEDVHLDVNETATFNHPFRPLYFCYDAIVARYRERADDDAAKPYLLLLVRLLDDVFGDVRQRKRNLQEGGLVNWKLAWTYFPKDSIVYSWGRNCELLCKVVDTQITKGACGIVLAISGKVLRFDGEAFVWVDTELEIPMFDGNKVITDLPHYPLDSHADPEDVKARLTARGKKVLDYQGLEYCMYTGIGIFQEDKKLERHNVDSRILIDVLGYNKHHLAQGSREGKDPESQKNVVKGTGRGGAYKKLAAAGSASTAAGGENMELYTPVTTQSQNARQQAVAAAHKRQNALREAAAIGAATDSGNATARGSTRKKRLSPDEQARNKAVMLAEHEHELLFMAPVLEGYALKNKMWLSFYVDDIAPMIWNDKAYDHLVYDEQQKDLVLSFVENHGQRKQTDDVILGKGQGLIILLSGPPGTGKTLTAEAVADKTYRPLFYLQAEDLGINAATLGSNIKKVFEMATEWDAVILLDEADVFMAERNPNDIARNELVSIFLRELEYFRGIIFLTTNLYNTIDSAFRSRVSLHLLFKPLSPDARLMVWKKFLDRMPPPSGKGKTAAPRITELPDDDAAEGSGSTAAVDGVSEESPYPGLVEDDLKELALWQLNGREIKNAVKMVRAWCDNKDYAMTLARLQSGIKVTSPHAGKQADHAGSDNLYDD